MAKKTFEMIFQIGGKLNNTFSSSFSGAKRGLTELKNEARQTQRSLDQLGNDFRKGKIDQKQYAQSTAKVTRELERLQNAQDKVRRRQERMQTFKTGVSNGLNTAKNVAGMAAVGATGAAAGIAVKSLNVAADFEQQMSKVGVIAGASRSEVKKLNDTALDLGASTSKSSSEVAVAMGELAQKGMDTNQIISAMPGILAAAEASGEDLAMTSDVVTSALNAFSLDASKSSHVADVMAMSANATAAGVADLGYSFRYAAPVAQTLGISLEELAASTGIMVDKGLSGESAGTALRMALIRLSKPPKDAKKVLDKLNISVTDSEGKFKSMTKLSEEWNDATKDLTDTQKVAHASTVFGTEAATGMLNLFSAGPEEIDKLTKSLENSTGAAEKAAKAMKDNYAGSLEQLSGSIEQAQIKFMTPVLPVFQDLFSGITSTIDDSIGGIERAGQRLASGLRDIFDPFTSQEPVKPKFEDFQNMTQYKEAMEQYKQEFAKFELFSPMDFGDKVVYALDVASAKTEEWLNGSGGESMEKIFTKLGEIAGKAWYNAFTGSLKSSMSNFGEGNIFAGLAMAAVANALTGGLLLKGGLAGGKYIAGQGKNILTNQHPLSKKPKPTSKAPVNVPKTKGNVVQFPKTTNKATVPKTPKTPGNVVQFPKTKVPTATGTSVLKNVLSTSAKVASKAATPLAILMEGYNIFKAKDKTKAAVSGGAGLAGGFAGAKGGALIGSLAGPLGTAIGGVLGGILGYAGGQWAGGKVVDTVRQERAVTENTNPYASMYTPEFGQQANAASQPNTEAVNQAIAQFVEAMTQSTQGITKFSTVAGQASTVFTTSITAVQTAIMLSLTHFQRLSMSLGQASMMFTTSFTMMGTATNMNTMSLMRLATSTGQASGWMTGSFIKIKSSADNLSANLNSLASSAGQATGWLGSLSGISSSGQRVKTALDNLATKINNVQVPSTVGGNPRTAMN